LQLRLGSAVGFVSDVNPFLDSDDILRAQLNGQEVAVSRDEGMMDVGPEAGALEIRVHSREG
jgi:hypothetical protein